MTLIDVPQMKPLVHISGMFGAWRGNTSWVAPLAWHPDNRNAVIMVDLAGDISPLLELDSDTLRERLYTPKNELGDLPAVPVKLVHINKCPVLAQANTLRPEDADRLGINRQHCLDNLKALRENPQVREKVVAIFAEAEPFMPSEKRGCPALQRLLQRRRPCGDEYRSANPSPRNFTGAGYYFR
ncbi:exodeoxyribonuclease I [Enterobacter asburiae]|uniref:Exodeoxyribonuclease I n=1 Tax=Enterobacter asburiae TaxID=61645 RepID=A0A376FPU7_ENTAS|nr:exodeoxyribonuclease I [Enterobacter asburiae]